MKITIGDPVRGIAPKGTKPGRAKLPTQRIRSEGGKLVTVYTLDAASESLSNDWFTVFRRNVARARRQQRAAKKHAVAAE
jgi:hypothetical protein